MPPFTDAQPLCFEDIPFRVENFDDVDGCRRPCHRCGSTTSFLDEFLDEEGNCIYQCSDSDYCNTMLMQAKEDNYAANS